MTKSIKWVGKRLLRLFITIAIITMIAFIPTMYEYNMEYYKITSMDFSFSSYISSITSFFNQLIHGELGEFQYYRYGRPVASRGFSTDILLYYRYTIFIFLSGLLIGVFTGLAAGFFSLLMKEKWRNRIQSVSFIMAAIPDFFVILILQATIIWIYKSTGVRLAAVATGGNSTAYFLPIFTLSLLPATYIYRATLNSFEDVLTKRYIQTAYSKGLSKFKITWSHVIKNGLILVLNNLPTVIMHSISNLFIIEYMFNTHGITMFVFEHWQDTNVLIVGVFLIWILVEILLLLNDWILTKLNKYRTEETA